MSSPINIIKATLPKCDISLTPGRLDRRTETIPDAAQALAKFASFGGVGWLCATDAKEIRRFSPAQKLAIPHPEIAWPICGETVKGNASLHLQRGDSGWQLTVITREEAMSDDDIIVETVLKARDGQGDLRYETAWSGQAVANLEEIRPQAFRFLGFADGKEI